MHFIRYVNLWDNNENIFLAGDGFYIALGGAVAQYGWSHLQDVIQDKKFNVKLIDHSDDMAVLSLQGPKR